MNKTLIEIIDGLGHAEALNGAAFSLAENLGPGCEPLLAVLNVQQEKLRELSKGLEIARGIRG
jgi:hypothetical protein